MKLIKNSLLFLNFFILFASFHFVYCSSSVQDVYNPQKSSQSYFESFINWLYSDASYKTPAGNRFLNAHDTWLANLPSEEDKLAKRSIIDGRRKKFSFLDMNTGFSFDDLQKLKDKNNSKNSIDPTEVEELD